ncbi:hypothetical protein LXL04_006579 [Taraxacum kok-saghyz]
MKAFRAKQIAQKHVFGDFQKQYALLWDYGLELKRTNVGTTFKVDVYSEPNVNSQTRMFKRVYVSLGPLKLGFKAGLKKIPLEQWSLSHFSGRAKTDSLTSNVCEVFNSKILDARDKPVIICLEYIREYLMKRIVDVRNAGKGVKKKGKAVV